MKALLAIIGAIVLVLVLIAYGAFAYGVVMYNFWYWFITPVFSSAPIISVSQAIGLNMFTSIITIGISKKQSKKEEGDKWTTLGTALFTPWFLLELGYFVHLLIS